MKTLAFNLVLAMILIGVANAGYVFPTFDNYRGYWLDRETTPIVVDTGTALGLTNPYIGLTDYDFKFEVIQGSIDFSNPSYSEGTITYNFYSDNTLIIEGQHDGPGGPIEGITMTGYGSVNVYERSLCSEPYELTGSFTVVPEPTTICLLGIGSLLLARRKR